MPATRTGPRDRLVSASQRVRDADWRALIYRARHPDAGHTPWVCVAAGIPGPTLTASAAAPRWRLSRLTPDGRRHGNRASGSDALCDDTSKLLGVHFLLQLATAFDSFLGSATALNQPAAACACDHLYPIVPTARNNDETYHAGDMTRSSRPAVATSCPGTQSCTLAPRRAAQLPRRSLGGRRHGAEPDGRSVAVLLSWRNIRPDQRDACRRWRVPRDVNVRRLPAAGSACQPFDRLRDLLMRSLQRAQSADRGSPLPSATVTLGPKLPLA